MQTHDIRASTRQLLHETLTKTPIDRDECSRSSLCIRLPAITVTFLSIIIVVYYSLIMTHFGTMLSTNTKQHERKFRS